MLDHSHEDGIIIKDDFYRIVTVQDEPFVFVNRTSSGQVKFSGFTIDLLGKIAESLNFTYELYECPDKLYGTKNKNGEWNGMIGELTNGRADLAVSGMTVTPQREIDVDFTQRYLDYSVALAMYRPKHKFDIFAFFKPFNLEVWLSIVGAYFVVSGLLYLFNHMHLKTSISEKTKNSLKYNDSSMLGTFWFVYSAIVQQSSDMMLVTLSAQIITGVWWFFILIVISSYTANLAAYLTVDALKKPISSFQDLAQKSEQENLTFGTVYSTSFMDYLEDQARQESNPEGKFTSLYRMSKDFSVETPQEGFELVRNGTGSYAFMFDYHWLDIFDILNL